MPDPRLKNLMADSELVEFAHVTANQNERKLRHVKEDARRDASVYEDRSTGERRTLPNKFVRAIGKQAAFELVDPEIERDAVAALT